jgi:hypothetical protein
VKDLETVPVPAGLRPGQLGVVMIGHVVMGDIAVTLVDLAMRDLVRVEESSGPAGDATWRVGSVVPAISRQQPGSLLGYERKLLDAMPGPAGSWCLTALPPDLPSVLAKVRSAVVGEAVHQGWLRRLHHDKRTAEGDEMARRIRAFYRGLKGLKNGPSESVLGGVLLPYALRFGLISRDQVPLARFAQAWVQACAGVSGWRAKDKPREFDDDALFGPRIDSLSSGYMGPGI